jgi:hypothetical protein
LPPPPLSLTPHSIAKLQGNTFQFSNYGLTSFFAVGSSLYLIVRSQFPVNGTGSGTNQVQVFKSTDKTTWTMVASVPLVTGDTNQGCSIVLVGTVVYILAFNTITATQPLFWHRFDTATDTFLADTAAGPNSGALGFSSSGNAVSDLNSGHILVTQDAPPSPGTLTFYEYNPTGDVWGSGTAIAANGQVAAQIHDPATDLTFVFYMNGAGTQLRCATITAGFALTDVLVKTLAHSLHNGDVGVPVISSGLNEVVLPFKHFPIAGAPELLAGRATVGATPTFTVDTVETVASLPAGFLIQQWDQNSCAPWYAFDISGTLYIFYAVDNGDLDSGSSQSSVYYRSSSAVGTWDPSNIAYSSVIPGEMFQIMLSSVAGFNPVVLVGIVDPTTFPADASLTNFILFGAAAPVVSATPTPLATGGGPYVTPKPCLCDVHELGFEELARFRQRKRAWPYIHRMPPPGAIRVRADGSIAVPTAVAGETQGIAYTVDEGFVFALEALAVEFLASGLPGTVDPGDFTWTLDLNKPVGVGTFQGQSIQGFTQVDIPLGSLVIPWPLEMPDLFAPNDTIRSKFFNVNLTPGDPNFFKTVLLGWRWPA